MVPSSFTVFQGEGSDQVRFVCNLYRHIEHFQKVIVWMETMQSFELEMQEGIR